nr:retrovirus-related Pol polyprotein from transposon TNT 1-94 [Tanacetum cinerariifolium]
MGDSDDLVNKSGHDQPKITKKSDVDASSPYYLHPSDHPGINICQVVLKGEIFQEWERSMHNAFRAKRKLGFLDGVVKKPDDNAPEIEDWWSVNSMLLAVGYPIEMMEPLSLFGDRFLAIFGDWVNSNIGCLMILVYAPQELTRKQVLWNTLSDIVLKFNGPSVVLGDFNEEAKAKGRLEGIKVGINSIGISHLQFADDALIL